MRLASIQNLVRIKPCMLFVALTLSATTCPAQQVPSAADASAAIQKELDSKRFCHIPPGTHRVENTIFVNADCLLELAHGATLIRQGQNTRPLVQLTGNFASLVGHGWLRSDVDTPAGIVHVGPRDPKMEANINWIRIRDVVLEGNGGPSSIGLALSSSEPIAGGSNYNGSFSDLVIRRVGLGVDVGQLCNAHTFSSCFFYDIGRHSYVSRRNTENTFIGGFTHFSKQLSSVIRLEETGHNLFYGVQAEPGGEARYFEIDERSWGNQILGHDNCKNGPIDKGQATAYLSHGQLRLHNVMSTARTPEIELASLNDGVADATAALQAAIDSAAKRRRPLTLAPGIYSVSGQLVLRSGTRLLGNRQAVIRAAKPIADGMLMIEKDASQVELDGIRLEILLTHTGMRNEGPINGITLRNCDFLGSLPQTNFLVDLAGDVQDVTIRECSFSTTLSAIQLRDAVRGVMCSENTFRNWKTYGVLLRSGDSTGPSDVTISGNRFFEPAPGTGGARQMIVAYGEPKTRSATMLGIRVLNNSCLGAGEPWDKESEASRGSADQIALHWCRDFVVDGNMSIDGGENGITITRFCEHGVVSNNVVSGNDGHGIQISGLGDRSKDILVTGNICRNNGLRRDGMGDVMAGIYVQDGARIGIHGNHIIDNRTPRLQKHGIHIAVSDDVDVGKNTIQFADPKGALDVGIFSKTRTAPEK